MNIKGTNRESTGNVTIDMVISCVAQYRRAMRPIKTIYLRPVYFQDFCEAIWRQMEKLNKEIPESMTFEWDKVAIKRASELQADALTVDFWEMFPKKEESKLVN